MPTLIIEDGTCPEGANCYASLEQADAYCVQRGLWPESKNDQAIITSKQAALIRAADWLNGMDWKGISVDMMRVMAWPRGGVQLSSNFTVQDNVVPPAVIIANVEAAALFYGGEDPFAPMEHGGAVAAYSESVGPLSESKTYKAAAPVETAYRAVTARLRMYLDSVEGEASGCKVIAVGKG